MMSRFSCASALTGLALLGAAFSTPAADEETTGSRYDLPRAYHSEISAAEAYLLTSGRLRHRLAHWRTHKDRVPKPVILDVRSIKEHLAGHPPGAYSVPFPKVQGSPGDMDYIGYDVSTDPEKVGFGATRPERGVLLEIGHFVDYVKTMFPDTRTPIFTLCKTGYRSVQAANALAQEGYTNVRNIWPGYVGKPKYAYDKRTGAPLNEPRVLDLDNDGVVKDDPDDLDGWANFEGLPTTTRIHPGRIDLRFVHLYY